MRTDPDNQKKAFLGGFRQKTRPSIKAAAESFIGSPEGLIKVEVLGNVCSGAVIVFSSAEAMHKFISDNESRAKDDGRFLKPNQAPLSQEERARKKFIWQGKQKLVEKGVPKEKALFSRSRFWTVGADDAVKVVGKLNGNTIVWNQEAPEGLKNTSTECA